MNACVDHQRLAAATRPGPDSGNSRFEEILRSQYPGLVGLLIRRCGSRADAADLLHDAICIAMEHHTAGRITDIERLAGYVFQTALNLLRNRLRLVCNKAERWADESVVDEVADDKAAAAFFNSNLIVEQVRAAVASLRNERDRILLKRFYLDEESKETLCRDLRITAMHFDKVIFRARQRMKEALADRGVDADWRSA